MKIIWVLNNIKKSKDFYSKLYTLITLASVRLWKRFYPNDITTLYCDELTLETFRQVDILKYWDKVELYIPSDKIDHKIFWAAGKLEILAQQDEPVFIVDNDLHIFKPIKDYLEKGVSYVHNLELGKGYYPGYVDPFVRRLSYKPRWKNDSVNVSLLHLPDVSFAKLYANKSIEIMEEFSAMDVPHSQYLIFAEQLLLSHLFDVHKIDYKSIVSTYWDCNEWEWGEDHDRGIWPLTESGMFIKHYGPLKGFIMQNKADQNYEKEYEHLVNCINLPNLDLTAIEKQ